MKFLLFFLYLFLFINSIDIADEIDSCEDESTCTISSGFFYIDTLTISRKENLVIDHQDVVVLECADETIMNPSSSTWSSLGSSLYSTSFTKNSCSEKNLYGAYGLRISDDPFNFERYNQRLQLWVYPDLSSIQSHEIGEGIFFDTSSSTLYIYLDDNKNPNSLPDQQQLFISCGECFKINRCNDLKIGKDDIPFVVDNGAEFTVKIKAGSDVDLQNFYIFGGIGGVRFYEGASRSGIRNSVVKGFPRNDVWFWQDYKSNSLMLGDGIGFKKSSYDNYCFNNSVSGYFNGITAQNSEGMEEESYCNPRLKIHQNRVFEIQDDAFEIEPCNVDVEVFENIVFNTYTGISVSPMIEGPLYVYNNLIMATKLVPKSRPDNYESPKVVKAVSSDASPENVKFYHNTMISQHGKVIMGYNQYNDRVLDFEYYNNIFYQIYKDYDYIQCILKHSGLSTDGNQYDYNVHFTTEYGKTYMYGNYNEFKDSDNSYYTLADVLQSTQGQASGWDLHSIEGDPGIDVDLKSGRYYSISKTGVAYQSAGVNIIPSSWPMGDLLSQIPAAQRDMGINNLLGSASSTKITCFGILDSSETVCSGHGECTALDQCECEYGYKGEKCETSWSSSNSQQQDDGTSVMESIGIFFIVILLIGVFACCVLLCFIILLFLFVVVPFGGITAFIWKKKESLKSIGGIEEELTYTRMR